jgi:hypothetical protein
MDHTGRIKGTTATGDNPDLLDRPSVMLVLTTVSYLVDVAVAFLLPGLAEQIHCYLGMVLDVRRPLPGRANAVLQ